MKEYFSADLVGCNSEGELYNGLACFVIVGLFCDSWLEKFYSIRD